MTDKHYQIRFVKRIRNDGTLITFRMLGHPYEHQNQKTLNSYHSLDEVVRRAIEYNPDLPPHVKGMVIVRFQAGGARISAGRTVNPYVGTNPRRKETANSLLFIDREGKPTKIIEGSHRIR
jgi:hypothetical protein